MKTSSLQFSDPHMTKASFSVNKEFSPAENVDIPIQISVHRNWNEGESNALIELEVTIGKDSAEFPFYVSVSYEANFKWEEDVVQGSTLETLLSQNAPALLLGYVRPAIASITNFSIYPSYNIPFINFTEEK